MPNSTPLSALRGPALAADQTFGSEASFLAAVPGLTMESFETLGMAPQSRRKPGRNA